MLSCKATFILSKAEEATTEILHFEASTDDELFGKIRAHAELANRKGFTVDRVTTETGQHEEPGSSSRF
jgi:hypothetical protein